MDSDVLTALGLAVGVSLLVAGSLIRRRSVRRGRRGDRKGPPAG